MGFIKTLLSICGGTALFPKLLEGSMFRALWHLLLLAFCVAVFTLSMRAIPVRNSVQSLQESFSLSFGSLRVSDEAILPEKKQDEPGSACTPGFIRIDYFPSPEAIDTKEILNDTELPRGIVWTPSLALLWTRALVPESWFGPMEEKYVLMPFAYRDKILSSWPGSNPVSPSELQEKLKALGTAAENIKGDSFFRIYPGLPMLEPLLLHLWDMLLVFMLSSEFLMAFFGVFSFSVFYASFTALICYNSWRELNPNKKLSLGGVFAVGLYTGFPAVIIASCFPALDLPFLDYRWAFTLCFLAYFFPVFNRIQKSLQPPKKTSGRRGSSDNDDDIFF